jgi:hypothetical protein
MNLEERSKYRRLLVGHLPLGNSSPEHNVIPVSAEPVAAK